MSVVPFTTKSKAPRQPQPVQVTFCGEQFVVERPKDATLFFASRVVAEDVPEGDRAQALLQFVQNTLDPITYKRFLERALDPADPVDLQATLRLVAELVDRWNNWPARGPAMPVVIKADPAPPLGDPIDVVDEDLGLDFVAHPPKDLLMAFVAAALATGANPGQQAWSIGIFMDAVLDPETRSTIRRRLVARHDDLDIGNLADLVRYLIGQWNPDVVPVVVELPRAQRRARTAPKKQSAGAKKPAATSTRRGRA